MASVLLSKTGNAYTSSDLPELMVSRGGRLHLSSIYCDIRGVSDHRQGLISH